MICVTALLGTALRAGHVVYVHAMASSVVRVGDNTFSCAGDAICHVPVDGAVKSFGGVKDTRNVLDKFTGNFASSLQRRRPLTFNGGDR